MSRLVGRLTDAPIKTYGIAGSHLTQRLLLTEVGGLLPRSTERSAVIVLSALRRALGFFAVLFTLFDTCGASALAEMNGFPLGSR